MINESKALVERVVREQKTDRLLVTCDFCGNVIYDSEEMTIPKYWMHAERKTLQTLPEYKWKSEDEEYDLCGSECASKLIKAYYEEADFGMQRHSLQFELYSSEHWELDEL